MCIECLKCFENQGDPRFKRFIWGPHFKYHYKTCPFGCSSENGKTWTWLWLILYFILRLGTCLIIESSSSKSVDLFSLIKLVILNCQKHSLTFKRFPKNFSIFSKSMNYHFLNLWIFKFSLIFQEANIIQFYSKCMIINIQNVSYDPKNMLEELSGMSSYKKSHFLLILVHHEKVIFHEIWYFQHIFCGWVLPWMSS